MKQLKTGDRYRPIVTVLKAKTTRSGKTYPTVIEVSGRQYQLRLAGHTKNRRARNNDNDKSSSIS